MCGLIGFSASKDSKFNIDKIRLLLLTNQERGKDSVGYYTPESKIVKELGKAEDVMSKKDFDIAPSNLLIGHVRAATVGVVNKENAHPFHFGNIVLAMNGTLVNHWDIGREYKLDIASYNVDSQILAAMLNLTQNKEPLTKIVGPCAIIYTDTNTNRLYCYRNSDRPLFRGNIDGDMYISSLETPLKVIGCVNVKEFKQDFLYEIENGAILNQIKVKRAEIHTPDNSANLLFRTINLYHIKNEDLIGMFLEPDHTFTEESVTFKKGYYYQVMDVDSHSQWKIGVRSTDGQYILVSKHMFSNKVPIVHVRDYVMGINSIYYHGPKPRTKLGSPGDIYVVLTVSKNSYYCKHLVNHMEATIPHELVRYASDLEVSDFRHEKIFKNLKHNPVDNEQSEINQELTQEELEIKEETIFKSQIEATEHNNFGELADFTMNELRDQVIALEEVTTQTNQLVRLNNMKTIIDNYIEKSIIFEQEEVEDAIEQC